MILCCQSFTGGWIEGLSNDGQVYYYNTVTGESSWKLPTGAQPIGAVGNFSNNQPLIGQKGGISIPKTPAAGALKKRTQSWDSSAAASVSIDESGEASYALVENTAAVDQANGRFPEEGYVDDNANADYTDYNYYNENVNDDENLYHYDTYNANEDQDPNVFQEEDNLYDQYGDPSYHGDDANVDPDMFNNALGERKRIPLFSLHSCTLMLFILSFKL
jgi:hypothetical protein